MRETVNVTFNGRANISKSKVRKIDEKTISEFDISDISNLQRYVTVLLDKVQALLNRTYSKDIENAEIEVESVEDNHTVVISCKTTLSATDNDIAVLSANSGESSDTLISLIREQRTSLLNALDLDYGSLFNIRCTSAGK